MSIILRQILKADTLSLLRTSSGALKYSSVNKGSFFPQHIQLHTGNQPLPVQPVHQPLHNHQHRRGKSKKTNKQSSRAADDDLENDEHDLDEEKDNYDDMLGDKHNRTVRVTVNSMRADLLLKAGLGVARNKVEAFFYDSKIRVNGKKLLKKSAQLEVDDEIDVVRGPSPNNPEHLVVSRVEIVSVSPRTENLVVTMRRHKSLVIENYKDHGAYVEADTLEK